MIAQFNCPSCGSRLETDGGVDRCPDCGSLLLTQMIGESFSIELFEFAQRQAYEIRLLTTNQKIYFNKGDKVLVKGSDKALRIESVNPLRGKLKLEDNSEVDCTEVTHVNKKLEDLRKTMYQTSLGKKYTSSELISSMGLSAARAVLDDKNYDKLSDDMKIVPMYDKIMIVFYSQETLDEFNEKIAPRIKMIPVDKDKASSF